MIPEAQPSRRLPVYILADRSGSMSGEAIVSVNQGLQFLKNDLEDEPRAVETVWISVISFGGKATVDVPLTELMAYNPPTLYAEGSTPMGEAMRLLNQAIDHDVVLSSGQHTGDYRPLIFLFTDGEPTDDWRSAARELKARTQAKTANIVAVGCGPSVNANTLKEITESVMMMENTNQGEFTKLMEWISMSVKQVSQKRTTADPSNNNAAPSQVNLPPLPGGFTIAL
jgi:uncharacterized protein YegL